MSDGPSARARILARISAAPQRQVPVEPPDGAPNWSPPTYGSERLTKFRAMLEASRADVHDVTAANWPERLKTILANKAVRTLLYAPATATGQQLASAWAGGEGPTLVPYDRPIEELKSALVHEMDAGLTTAKGGIAHTGSVIVWPNADEPRLASLLPPIHVVLVEADTIVDSLSAAITGGNWAGSLPTNALLISGPSKTADIEQTLAYGVHGPKELIVLVIAEVDGGDTVPMA